MLSCLCTLPAADCLLESLVFYMSSARKKVRFDVQTLSWFINLRTFAVCVCVCVWGGWQVCDFSPLRSSRLELSQGVFAGEDAGCVVVVESVSRARQRWQHPPPGLCESACCRLMLPLLVQKEWKRKGQKPFGFSK